MPSLLKKKTEGAASEMPPWHPNLRNASRLPDIKVVRTSFFVNGVAIFVAVVFLLWFLYQEYQLHDLNRQIAQWQTQIDRDKKDSDKFVALYKKFQAEQSKITDVYEFSHSRPPVSDLMMYIADVMSKDIALDSYEQTAVGLTLRGTVRGTPDEATGTATAFLDQLKKDPVIGQNFAEVAYSGTGVSRNPQSGRITLQLYLRFNSAPKGVKK